MYMCAFGWSTYLIMSISPSKTVVRECSTLQTIDFTLQWTVEHFSLYRGNTEGMTSKGITMAELGIAGQKGRWRIGLKPCCVHPHTAERFLDVGLNLSDDECRSTSYTGEGSFRAAFHISLATGRAMSPLVAKFSPLPHHFKKGAFFSATNSGIIKHRDLLPNIQDDSITVTIEVHLQVTKRRTFRVTNRQPAPQQYHHNFLQRQTGLLYSTLHEDAADFVLRSSNGQDFPVSRFLLMAQSPVFFAMLTQDAKIKEERRCQLDDVDGECMSVLLDYIYGCHMGNIHSGNAEEILIMADKYALTDLRLHCELVLASGLTAKAAAKYSALAEERNLITLKEEIAYYCAQAHYAADGSTKKSRKSPAKKSRKSPAKSTVVKTVTEARVTGWEAVKTLVGCLMFFLSVVILVYVYPKPVKHYY